MYRDNENIDALRSRLTDLYAEAIDLHQEIEELEQRLNIAYQDEEANTYDE